MLNWSFLGFKSGAVCSGRVRWVGESAGFARGVVCPTNAARSLCCVSIGGGNGRHSRDLSSHRLRGSGMQGCGSRAFSSRHPRIEIAARGASEREKESCMWRPTWASAGWGDLSGDPWGATEAWNPPRNLSATSNGFTGRASGGSPTVSVHLPWFPHDTYLPIPLTHNRLDWHPSPKISNAPFGKTSSKHDLPLLKSI